MVLPRTNADAMSWRVAEDRRHADLGVQDVLMFDGAAYALVVPDDVMPRGAASLA